MRTPACLAHLIRKENKADKAYKAYKVDNEKKDLLYRIDESVQEKSSFSAVIKKFIGIFFSCISQTFSQFDMAFCFGKRPCGVGQECKKLGLAIPCPSFSDIGANGNRRSLQLCSQTVDLILRKIFGHFVNIFCQFHSFFPNNQFSERFNHKLVFTLYALLALSALSAFPLMAATLPSDPTFGLTLSSAVVISVNRSANPTGNYYAFRATYTHTNLQMAVTYWLQLDGTLGATAVYDQWGDGAANDISTAAVGLLPNVTYYFTAIAADDATPLNPSGFTLSPGTVTLAGAWLEDPGPRTLPLNDQYYATPWFVFRGTWTQGVTLFKYVWDQSPTTDPSAGTNWGTGAKTLHTNASGSWYLHLSHEGAGGQIRIQHLGPYLVDRGAPVVSAGDCLKRNNSTWVTAAGGTCSGIDISTVAARANVRDVDSGLANGDQALGVSSATVLYLDFEEWPPRDKSGYNQVISTFGTTLAYTASGRFGGGASFPGASGNYIMISTMTQFSTAEPSVTLEAWFYTNNITNAREIFQFTNDLTVFTSIVTGHNTSDPTSGAMFVTGNTVANVAQRDHVVGSRWHYVAYTLTGSAAKLYLDGKLLSSSAGAVGNFQMKLLLGSYYDRVSNSWNGLMDEVRVS